MAPLNEALKFTLKGYARSPLASWGYSIVLQSGEKIRIG